MKKASSGFTLVELLVVIGILGILMGALFPAISSAMLSANTSAMAMNGRNLFTGIVQANVDREAHGRESVWPKNKSQSSGGGSEGGQTDIADKTFQNSDEYFEILFDMENYGTQDHNPYVGVDVKFLSGSGVPSYKGDRSLDGCVAWSIATDITDDMPDILPVLVTRNLDTTKFPKSGANNATTDSTVLTMGKEFPLPFGNKAAVIIHKGGAAGVYKGRYVTLSDIYEKQNIAFAGDSEIDYIPPKK